MKNLQKVQKLIYITVDVHIPWDVSKLSTKQFLEQKSLTRSDYVIICGDFGGVWSPVGEPESSETEYWMKWLKSKSFTTLFVDGNHENFDKLGTFPEIDLLGGRAHKIDDGIYHLMRGFVYEICGKRIFTMGGAESHDKQLRQQGKSWWSSELPGADEYERAKKSLEESSFKVDYVITHCAPTSIQRQIKPHYAENALTEFLEELKEKLEFKKWFFGHYHKDAVIEEKFVASFWEILKG